MDSDSPRPTQHHRRTHRSWAPASTRTEPPTSGRFRAMCASAQRDDESELGSLAASLRSAGDISRIPALSLWAGALLGCLPITASSLCWTGFGLRDGLKRCLRGMLGLLAPRKAAATPRPRTEQFLCAVCWPGLSLYVARTRYPAALRCACSRSPRRTDSSGDFATCARLVSEGHFAARTGHRVP